MTCPHCKSQKKDLQVIEIEIEADITDYVLACEECGKYWEIVPGKEIIPCEGDEDV